MANAAGFIQESIWRDIQWRGLSRGAQALYMQLLSQKELDCAGILPLQPNKWAKGCDGLTVEQVWIDLEELQEKRFVYYDTDTDEAFVRTYIRNSNVIKVPNMRKSARRAALLVGSEVIRRVLASELRATGDPDFIVTAEQIDPSLTPPEPFGKPFGNGSDLTLPEPLTKPTGVGVGVGVPHQGRSQVGGGARPHCSRHDENHEGPCRKCKLRREWDERHTADELEHKRAARAAAALIAQACPDCHGTNVVEIGEDRVRKCDHRRTHA